MRHAEPPQNCRKGQAGRPVSYGHGSAPSPGRPAGHHGGDLLLAAAREQVLRLLILTGLIGVFSVHASTEQAAAAAGGSHRAAAPVPGRSVVLAVS